MKFYQLSLSTILFLLISTTALRAQQEGYACIYSKKLCGRRTSSGAKLNCTKLTAAHLHFKLGTKVRVVNLENDKTVVVTINDRGPYSKKFIIDLTPAAAKAIGLSYGKGIVRVRLEEVAE